MRVSVITVCYNSAASIVDTLQAVASQLHDDIEHIVVDGGSSDGTIELVQRHGKHVDKFISEPDKGIYDAMNKGLALATGDYVAYLNSDDFYTNNETVSRVVAAIRNTKSDTVFGDLSYVQRENPSLRVRYWKSQAFQTGSFARGHPPPHPTFFIRRELLVSLKGFDVSYRLASDFDLMFRALEVEKCTSTYLPNELVRMRMGGATNRSITSILYQNQEILRCLRSHGVSVSTAEFAARKILSRLKQRYLKSSAIKP